MGLFSRKKKELKVPAPPSDDVLKFPKPSQDKKVKEEKELPPPPEHPSPEKIKEAVGVEKPEEPLPEIPPDKIEEDELPPPKEMLPLPEPFSPPERPSFITKKPSFIRMQNYQMLLDNLNAIKNTTIEMNKLSEDIEKSEFNENKNYERLKNDLKKILDRLLSIDVQIFKK